MTTTATMAMNYDYVIVRVPFDTSVWCPLLIIIKKHIAWLKKVLELLNGYGW